MRFNWLILCCLVSTSLCQAGVNIQHWQTSNGSRVYFVQTPSLPMVDVRVSFDAGSARDGAQFGLAALTASLLETSAGPWSADEVATQFESVGAAFSNGISRDMAWLAVRSLTEPALLDRALATFKTVLSQPQFAKADFQREKNNALAALKHREESPAALASMAFYNALYHDHPYAHPEQGIVQTVAGFEAADVKRFYQRFYVASNAVVVIVGDVSRPHAESMAQTLMQPLKSGQAAAPLAPVNAPEQASQQHLTFPSSQTHVLAGVPASYRKDPDYFALYVGNHILGGGALVSQLFDEVREKRGLAYSAASQLSPLAQPGPFVMSLQTRNDQTQQALDVMLQTLRRFVELGPTAAELTAAKQNITGGFAMRTDTNSKLADYVTMIGFYQQPLDYLDSFARNIEAVTMEAVKDAFQRRINPDRLQTVTVGGN